MRRWHARGRSCTSATPRTRRARSSARARNLALVDAMVLADCLAEARLRGDGAPRVLARARRRHLGFYQFASRWLTPFFQSDHGALGPLRDSFMPLAGRLPPVRRLMVRSMTGTVQGLLRAPLALPAPPAQLAAGTLAAPP